jgi:hypothetical protein
VLQCVARPVPIYFLGDSLTSVFADRVYHAPGDPRRYIARTKYLHGITAAAFADGDSVLHPEVMTALLSECIVVHDDDDTLRAMHRSRSRQWRYAAVTMGRPRQAPALVVMCGSLDAAQLMQELGPDADFALPPGLAAHDLRARGETRVVESEDVLERVERRAAGLERGLRALRALGLDELYVHSIAPANRDDEAFSRVLGFASRAELRYKVQVLLNDRLRTASERAGVPFLDLWPETTDGPWIRDDVMLDAAHFNHRGALLTMERVLALRSPALLATAG